ncbi:MAG: hypothetical protein OEO84_09190 [Betaproteobacteria bacterium]|nr:hypothetical protein [Betaproteobacteria bacterium]
MRRSQLGLGWFGSLVVLALAVGAGYYAYQQLSVPDETPSCAAAQNACQQKCRRTASDNTAMQACQQACRREADTCAAMR